jgi:hypothetical protein
VSGLVTCLPVGALQVEEAEGAMCGGDFETASALLTALLDAPLSPDTRARALQYVLVLVRCRLPPLGCVKCVRAL